MKNTIHILLLLLAATVGRAQVSPNCVTASDDDYDTGKVFFNYGSVSNAVNSQFSTKFTFGQIIVGDYFSTTHRGAFGFWARYLNFPGAPSVLASEGDLADRVQVKWYADPLSPKATSFKLYRDGALLATLDGETFSYVDFNVIAGKFYKYEVSGVNEFGEGGKGESIGFLNPNGVVTGRVTTVNGNPVPEAIVTLSPTLGAALAFDGDDMAFSEYDTVFPRAKFTVSAWVKLGDGNDGSAIFDFGSTIGKNWWLHTTPAASGKGVQFSIGNAPAASTALSYVFPTAAASDWHHVAATYNGSSLLLYVDGELTGTAVGSIKPDSIPLFFGRKPDSPSGGGGGFFKGKFDEVRFFNRQLPQSEIQQFMNRSVSANTPGLAGYWKFDENAGSKAFDQSPAGQKIYFCGAAWTNDKPNVVNAGVTDVAGFYEIAGVNYGAGQTFTAEANKTFHFNQSLEFNAANQSRADLSDFDLPDSSTVTLFVKGFDFSANEQVILSKTTTAGNNFLQISVRNGNVEMTIGLGTPHSFGALGMGFQHLAFTLRQSGNSLEVNFYKNGVLEGTKAFPFTITDFTGLPWKLGARKTTTLQNALFFTGLIDEAAFFNTLLPLPDIQKFANTGTDVSHANLFHFFNLNEGSGTKLRDSGTALSGSGTTHATSWSTAAALTQVLAHEMNPGSRLVTLNPTSTAVDQVDFTDLSTVPVSGFVRFEGTTCFQKKVEILVNGESASPPTFTDKNGKFILDLEPGVDVKLSPKFQQHTFSPPFWELNAVSAPVSGILFRNQTTRKVHGQMAGNEACRKSIIPSGATTVQVKIATLDGCYERIKTLTGDGIFTFEGVPPDSVTVSVIEHPNTLIYTQFQSKGGFTLDLKSKNDTVAFIYLAPPQVEISALDTNACGDPMYSMLEQAQVTIKVFEEYDGVFVDGDGKCYLDTAQLTILNNIADLQPFDTLMKGGSFVHKFRVESPNIVPPYLKTLEVKAKAHDQQDTKTVSAVVLGRRPRQNNFVSKTPEIPLLILRDPPGDGSYAYQEEATTTCNSWSISASDIVNTGASVTISLGPDFESQVGTPFYSTTLDIDVTDDLGFDFQATTTAYSSNEMETCITTSRTISTSDNEEIVGSEMGGDLYLGGAMNFLFGITDELLWNKETCGYYLDKGMYTFPQGFNTTYVYTEWEIKNVVIPNLELANDPVSAQRWRAIIDRNTALKNSAVFSENISFGAGTVYEKSETTEITKSETTEWVQQFDEEMIGEYGVSANGVGLVAGLNVKLTTEESKSSTNSANTSKTIGYVLADNDIGDLFTVNVKQDKAYGTPVFELVSGQSQCPHEPNTQPRQGVSFTADKQIAVNVPMNDVAIFKLRLGNVSQTEETQTYELKAVQESNPFGAEILFNGLPELSLTVPFGEPVVVIMTVGRGNVTFKHQNLKVAFFSDCDPVPGELYQELAFDVEFLEPCSEVDVTSPLQNWVLTPNDGNTLLVTTSFYDVTDPDLKSIRVQYRRTNGDGDWINIGDEIEKADLGAVFEITPWNTQGLSDGFYEIRAETECFGGQNPGSSHVIQGKIERTPPEIFGTPEPADGVLSPGDEISVTFNEPIRCDLLLPADVTQNNNVGVYNTSNNQLVGFNFSCSGDKIVLVLTDPNQFIENEILRVQIDSVKDLVGNAMDSAKWEFFVDRNPLRWQTPNLVESKYDDESKTIYRTIVNTGGSSQSYDLTGIPAWVNVYPTEGTLPPGQVQLVTFEFGDDLVKGQFLDTIFMDCALGDEALPIDFRNLCRPPAWEINPADFDFSMNLTVQLDIEGTLSKDEQDIVAAFVDGELRGMAFVEHFVAGAQLDTFEVFLTVYGNSLSGEEVTFQIWDADKCLLYGDVLEKFPFVANGIVGAPNAPVTLHTNNLLLREIPLHGGWNWLSFNLAFPNPDIDTALASLAHPENDVIKSQTTFSSYVGAPVNGWAGSLATLGNLEMYQFRVNVPDTITMLGHPIAVPNTPISVVPGWNWIGYLPQNPLPVNEALASLTPLDGDVVKNQTAFAQYVAGFGWLGNLDFMQAPEGYLLKVANVGTLNYPDHFTGGGAVENRNGGANPPSGGQGDGGGSPWSVNPAEFEQTMILIGTYAENGENATREGLTLGAFVTEEVRGVAPATYIEQLGRWLFFMTTYANQSGEALTFKLHDAANDAIADLQEGLVFTADDLVGSVLEPMPFTLPVSAAGEAPPAPSRGFDCLLVQPNPFKNSTLVSYEADAAGEVMLTVTDALGRLVERLDWQIAAGRNTLEWKAEGLPGGVYFLKVGAVCRKVVLER